VATWTHPIKGTKIPPHRTEPPIDDGPYCTNSCRTMCSSLLPVIQSKTEVILELGLGALPDWERDHIAVVAIGSEVRIEIPRHLQEGVGPGSL
jgi:hypothetical protein